jgi:cell fate (sporulation/competence/biofilm development) regulator YlbF (YheA/YmcA/DUF963 family)
MKLPEIKNELEVVVKNFPEQEKLSGLLGELKKEISDIETNINVETDLKPVAEVVGKIEVWQKATIDAIRDIPEPKEAKDYTESFLQIQKIVKDRKIDFSELVTLLKEIASKEVVFDNSEVSSKLDKLDALIEKVSKIKFEIPSRLIYKDNIKVSVDRAGGGSGGSSGSSVSVTNLDGLATEAKQDDIVTAIDAISGLQRSTDMDGGGKVSVGTTAVEVTFAGTPESIIISADPANTGTLYVGKSTVTNAGANALCFLQSGESITIEYSDITNAVFVVSNTASQHFWKGCLL